MRVSDQFLSVERVKWQQLPLNPMADTTCHWKAFVLEQRHDHKIVWSVILLKKQPDVFLIIWTLCSLALNQVDGDTGFTRHTKHTLQKENNKSTVRDGMTSVTKKAMEDLTKRAAAAQNLEKEKNKAEKSSKTAAKMAKKLSTEHKNVKQQNKELVAKITKLEAAPEPAPAPVPVTTCKFLCIICELLDKNRLTHFSELQLQPQCHPQKSSF